MTLMKLNTLLILKVYAGYFTKDATNENKKQTFKLIRKVGKRTDNKVRSFLFVTFV